MPGWHVLGVAGVMDDRVTRLCLHHHHLNHDVCRTASHHDSETLWPYHKHHHLIITPVCVRMEPQPAGGRGGQGSPCTCPHSLWQWGLAATEDYARGRAAMDSTCSLPAEGSRTRSVWHGHGFLPRLRDNNRLQPVSVLPIDLPNTSFWTLSLCWSLLCSKLPVGLEA